MSDQPPRWDTPRDGPDHSEPDVSRGMARWQKMAAIVGLAVLVVVVVLLAGGEHGPRRHAPGGQTQQPAEVEDGSLHDPSRWNH